MDDSNATPAPAAGGSAREARRRKILDRGTDRLAFITGQTKSVPPPQPSSDSTPPPQAASISEKQQQQREPVHGEVDLPCSNEANLARSPLTDETTRKSMVTDIGVELLPKRESSDVAAVSAPKARTNPERLIPSVTESLSSQKSGAESSSWQESKHRIFTVNRISHCVSSSENIRLLCAVAMALFVVLSHQGVCFGGKMVAGLLNFRPIYLVLVTDITLVLALLLMNRELLEKVDGATQINRKEYDLADLMHLGLLAYKVTRAAIADCCLFVVLVIIGIPFGGNLVQ